MKNIKELRELLVKNLESLQEGTMERNLVAELNNTAGKVMASVIVELKYQGHMGQKRKIDFIEYDNAEIESTNED